jgi:hypothetical protein
MINNMKLHLGLLQILFSSALAVAQETSPTPVSFTSQETARIQQQADLYRINRVVALSKYETLFGSDELQAGRAADFFEQHKAYEMLAAALPELPEVDRPVIHHYLRDILLEKKTFSKPVVDVLITELDRLNATPVNSANEGGDTYFLQGRIVKAISHWLGIPDPQLDFSSRASVQAFIAFARQKAATTPNTSPFD